MTGASGREKVPEFNLQLCCASCRRRSWRWRSCICLALLCTYRVRQANSSPIFCFLVMYTICSLSNKVNFDVLGQSAKSIGSIWHKHITVAPIKRLVLLMSREKDGLNYCTVCLAHFVSLKVSSIPKTSPEVRNANAAEGNHYT
jgi:hypothetical protein